MTQAPDRHTVSKTEPANELAALVGPFWSAEKVRSELNLDDDDLDRAAVASDLLALETSDGVLVYPIEQFVRVDGVVRVKPAIQAMLRVLEGLDRWSVAVLLAMEALEPLGQSPYDAERSGVDQEHLVEYARIVARVWRQ
jgi:hypothetical protein